MCKIKANNIITYDTYLSFVLISLASFQPKTMLILFNFAFNDKNPPIKYHALSVEYLAHVLSFNFYKDSIHTWYQYMILMEKIGVR